jgi:hypothetical protein
MEEYINNLKNTPSKVIRPAISLKNYSKGIPTTAGRQERM